MRPKKEILVGDVWRMELYAEKFMTPDSTPHPLQDIVEEAIASLSSTHQEIYFMRFGEGLPIRTIARNLGYSSHQIIQAKIARIMREVREYVERATTQGDTSSGA